MDEQLSRLLDLRPWADCPAWTSIWVPLSITIFYTLSVPFFRIFIPASRSSTLTPTQQRIRCFVNFFLALGSFTFVIPFIYHLRLPESAAKGDVEWCLSEGSQFPDALRQWLYLYSLYRYSQLLETWIHICNGHKFSEIHVSHHVAMFWTAWLWTRTDGLLIIGLLALVNAFDNFLLYLGYFLQDAGLIGLTGEKRWKDLLQKWTEIETATGYSASACYVFYYFILGRNCGGFRVFVVSAAVHATVGYFLNRFRQKQYKPFSVIPLWVGAICGYFTYTLLLGWIFRSPQLVHVKVALFFAIIGGSYFTWLWERNMKKEEKKE